MKTICRLLHSFAGKKYSRCRFRDNCLCLHKDKDMSCCVKFISCCQKMFWFKYWKKMTNSPTSLKRKTPQNVKIHLLRFAFSHFLTESCANSIFLSNDFRCWYLFCYINEIFWVIMNEWVESRFPFFRRGTQTKIRFFFNMLPFTESGPRYLPVWTEIPSN